MIDVYFRRTDRRSIRWGASHKLQHTVQSMLLLPLLAALLSLGIPSAKAAGSVVTNLNDSGAGSLRQAIADATPGTTITFAVIGTITLTSGELVVNKDLTISGPSATSVALNGNRTNIALASRVIHNTAHLTITGLAIRNGDAGPGSGGGILNSATGVLTITDSIIAGNWAQQGGGLYNSSGGSVTISNTTLSENGTRLVDVGIDANGAGIYNAAPAGTVQIVGSTFSSNNVHDHGSGLYNAATAMVVNSTFSLNQAGTAAVYNASGNLQINNATITLNNGRKDAPGLFAAGGTVNLANSIAAQNTTSGNKALPDCAGTITSAGHNLIGNATGCGLSGGTGDLIGSNSVPIDAKLGPLVNNGGPTSTHALLTGSPALNAGSNVTPGSGGNACATTDQRGVVRNAPCDIGAYEAGTVSPAPIISGLAPAVAPANGAGFTLTLYGSQFVNGSTAYLGGVAHTTTYLGAGQLAVSILPSDLMGTAGPRIITVANPSPGGGTSNAITLLVYTSGSLHEVALPVITH